MPIKPNDPNFTVGRVKLDPAQRQRAMLLEQNVHDDPMGASFEIIYLRDRVKQLREALTWAGEHSYAGGKAFKHVEPVKSALSPED